MFYSCCLQMLANFIFKFAFVREVQWQNGACARGLDSRFTHGTSPSPPPEEIISLSLSTPTHWPLPLSAGGDDWVAVVEPGLHFTVLDFGPGFVLGMSIGIVEKGRNPTYSWWHSRQGKALAVPSGQTAP